MNDAVAEGLVIGGGRDGGAEFGRGVEGGVGHGERAKDFALAEAVEGFVGEAFQGDAEKDESNVAIFGVGSGIVGERHRECCRKEFIAGAGAQEKLFVCRKAGRVGEEHAQRDLIAARVLTGKLPDDRDQGHVEIEEAALVEEHRHGRGGQDFGQGREVEERDGSGLRGGAIEGEVAEGSEGYEFVFVRNSDGGGGEGAGGDGIIENAEGVRETGDLIVEGGDEWGQEGFSE